MRSYCVLIDAGFLKLCLGTPEIPAKFEDIDAFLTSLEQCDQLRQLSLHRIFVYDAKPFTGKKKKPLNGGEIDFGATEVARRNNELLTRLCARPFVALRLGDLVFRGWRLRKHALSHAKTDVRLTAESIVPNLTQKGVDMRVGLDIAALALKRLVQVVVLVTADTDFIPAMKFARREGLQLFLVQMNGAALHAGLLEHSDTIIAFDSPHLAKSSKGKRKAPMKSEGA